MKSESETIYSVSLARISTQKQYQEGDTLPDQTQQCLRLAEKKGWTNLHEFEYVYSTTQEDKKYFDEILDFCKSSPVRIRYLVIKCIDRFGRQGAQVYSAMKAQLASVGVELVDAYGVIQPPMNTLEHLGVEYPWSKVYPSEKAELLEAQEAKGEATKILTRMIGAEIGYTQKGYATRQPVFGFQNIKVATPDGIRTIREPKDGEYQWIRKIYNLRATTSLTDKEIVAKLSKEGLRNRDRVKWMREPNGMKKPVGKSTGKPLTTKQLQRWVQKTEYAGIICEKWTHNLPVKAQYKGLVSIELFNRANRGKIAIYEAEDGSVNVERNIKVYKRNRSNPLFPFKNYMLCPICHKPFLGSSPKGKKERYPTYHCARDHRYLGYSRKDFHETIYNFTKEVRFKKEYIDLFRVVVEDVWRTQQTQARQEAIDYGKRVIELKEEQNSWTEKFALATNDIMRRKIEDKVSELEFQISHASENRNQQEQEELNIGEIINYCSYYMEHYSELIQDEANPLRQGAFYGLIFEKLPDYEEILNRTPQMGLLFELFGHEEASKEHVVTPLEFESRSSG